jgi:hypothetical protein
MQCRERSGRILRLAQVLPVCTAYCWAQNSCSCAWLLISAAVLAPVHATLYQLHMSRWVPGTSKRLLHLILQQGTTYAPVQSLTDSMCRVASAIRGHSFPAGLSKACMQPRHHATWGMLHSSLLYMDSVQDAVRQMCRAQSVKQLLQCRCSCNVAHTGTQVPTWMLSSTGRTAKGCHMPAW